MSSKTLRRKGNGTFGGQNAGKSFKIKGKQLPSTSVQRLFSAVYRPDTLNSSKSSSGDTVRVRPPLPAPKFDADFDTICVFFCPPSGTRKLLSQQGGRLLSHDSDCISSPGNKAFCDFLIMYSVMCSFLLFCKTKRMFVKAKQTFIRI